MKCDSKSFQSKDVILHKQWRIRGNANIKQVLNRRKFAPLYLPVDRFSHIPHWCIPVFGVFGPLIVFGPLLPDYSGYHHPLPSNPGWREARQVRTFIDFFKFNNKEAHLPFPKTMDIQDTIKAMLT